MISIIWNYLGIITAFIAMGLNYFLEGSVVGEVFFGIMFLFNYHEICRKSGD